MPDPEAAPPPSSDPFDHDRILLEAQGPDDRPPVRIFIGTEDGQWRAERVLLYSIAQTRDPSRTYEVHLMKNLPGFRDARWLTGFTNYRFLIPHLAGGRGRAIYNDVDQIYLHDPALLFDTDMGDAGYLSINERDTSVMLIDCERMIDVWPLDQVRTQRRKRLDRRAAATPGLWGRLDGGWNARDTEYEPGRSGLVHFTTIHTQPWMPFPKRFVYQHNPVGALWFDLEEAAEAEAFHVFSEERPSLQYRRLLARLRDAPERPPAPCDAERSARDALIDSVGASSVLAYGIGGADAATTSALERAGRTVAWYDPASRSLEKKPAETFDAVVFTHGLEAVPDADLSWLVETLFQHARDALCVSIRDDAPNPNGVREGWPRDRFFWSARFAAAAARHPHVDWRLVGTRAGADGRREIAWLRGRPAGAPRVWVVADGSERPTREATALADALGFPYEVRDAGTELAPPWPDLAIASGSSARRACRTIADGSRGAARIVSLGCGENAIEGVDLSVPCAHDRLLPHPRRVETTLPLSDVTDASLAAARAARPELGGDGGAAPLVLLVCDGSHCVFDPPTARALAADVVSLAAGRPVLAITRPGADRGGVEALAAALGEGGRVLPFDRAGYAACLAHADAIVVAGDDDRMLADAAATHAPVAIRPLARRPRPVGARLREWVRRRAYARPTKRGKGSVRPQTGLERLCSRALASDLVRVDPDPGALHASLVERGVASVLGDPEDAVRREPLRETAAVARRVRALLGLPAGPSRG